MTLHESVDRDVETFGPYRILRPLGHGGMGEVHEAFDTVRERRVALKRILDDQVDDAARARFRRESRIAATLSSPHVVPIHDFGVIDGRLYIDMRLVPGVDLARTLRADGPLPPTRTASITKQLANALDAAHEAGLVHRDVKPSNALLTAHRGDDFVYLADFGVVHVQTPLSGTQLTETGMIIGTIPYMAPEQLRGGAIDHRIDVYALGCVVFEMVTGRPPFVGDKLSVAHDHLSSRPPAPSDLQTGVPAGLDAAVLKALEKDPDQRWTTAGDLADAVRYAAPEARTPSRAMPVPSPRPPTTPPVGTRPAPAAERRTNRLAVLALVLGVLVPVLGIAAGVVSLGRIRRSGERGRLMAVGGIVIGVVATAATAVVAAWLVLHTPKVSPADLQAQIVAQSGLSPDQVRCPEALPARQGASVTCSATAGGRSQQLRVTATEVVDDQVRFTITVAR